MDISKFKSDFAKLNRKATTIDEFCAELELWKQAAAETKTITVEVNDSENQLVSMLEDIQKSAGVGHSFTVVVDPDEEGGRSYGIDGDGDFKIVDIKVSEDVEEVEEAEEEVEEEKEASVKKAEKLNRDEMITKLVNDSIDTIYSGENDSIEYLTSIFTNGFRGFDDLSDEELFGELDGRGLIEDREEYVESEEGDLGKDYE